jgi:hypothetical protein
MDENVIASERSLRAKQSQIVAISPQQETASHETLAVTIRTDL